MPLWQSNIATGDFSAWNMSNLKRAFTVNFSLQNVMPYTELGIGINALISAS